MSVELANRRRWRILRMQSTAQVPTEPPVAPLPQNAGVIAAGGSATITVHFKLQYRPPLRTYTSSGNFNVGETRYDAATLGTK